MAEVAQEAGRGRAGRLAPAVPACATFYYTVGGNDSYWRVEAPAGAVGARLAAVREKDAERTFTAPNRRAGLPWSMELDMLDGTTETISSRTAWEKFTRKRPRYLTARAVFPKHEGAAVFTRPDVPRAVLARAMQQQGIRTICEVDDNYFAPSNMNLFLRTQGQGDELRDAHAKAVVSMDAIVFSTTILRGTYRSALRERFGKKLPELHVCRNNIPRADWPDRVERDGPVRVGFMGSPSHVWDINLTYAAFHAAHTDGHETVVIGYNPGDPDPRMPDVIDTPEGPLAVRSERSMDFADSWRRVINAKPIPWIDPGDYHRAALPLDVGLCPLRVDAFNLGKSDVKAVEYTISGAAVVCQNMPVYHEGGWVDGVNCLMASTAEDFAYATLRLARDHRLRFELVTAAQEMVASERNEETLRREWCEVLDG